MATHVSSACISVISQRRVQRVRAVASEDVASLKVEEDKVKLGGSDLKVTRLGVGAWSWGDTSYWNNFEWDGKLKRKLVRQCKIVDRLRNPLQIRAKFSESM